MKPTGKNIIRAAAMLLGTVIGAGIFGVPYAILRGGTLAAILSFVFVGFVVIFFYLLYGEVVLRTKELHRLPGFAGRYLGPWGKRVATLSSVVGVYGILTAHTIIGGIFLQALLGPYIGQSGVFWGIVYFFVVAIVTYFGLGLVSRVESMLTLLFLVLIAALTIWSAPHIRAEYVWQVGDGAVFLPYGVIFFSLIGSTAIPQMRDALGASARWLKIAIFWSLLVAILFTAIFAFAVVGVGGARTTQDALRGMQEALGARVVFLGSFIGLLTVITTSFASALYLREVYHLDFKFSKMMSWLLVVAIPFFLYVFISPSFIHTIAVTGAVMGGMDGILITLMHRRAKKLGDRKPEYTMSLPRQIGNMLIAVFVAGMLIEIMNTFL